MYYLFRFVISGTNITLHHSHSGRVSLVGHSCSQANVQQQRKRWGNNQSNLQPSGIRIFTVYIWNNVRSGAQQSAEAQVGQPVRDRPEVRAAPRPLLPRRHAAQRPRAHPEHPSQRQECPRPLGWLQGEICKYNNYFFLFNQVHLGTVKVLRYP